MTPVHETAEQLPGEPFPASWSPLLPFFASLGIRLKAVAWGALLNDRGSFQNAEAEGSPYSTFSHNGTLFVSPATSLEALAHELGHAAAWILDGSPEGYNWGLDPNKGSPDEVSACEVEVWLLTSFGNESQEDMIRRHYEVGIIVQYDPDDDEDDYGEAPYAWEEFHTSVSAGKDLLTRALRQAAEVAAQQEASPSTGS